MAIPVQNQSSSGRPGQAPARRIVVGVDTSPAAGAAFAWACDEAARSGDEVIAVSVIEERAPILAGPVPVLAPLGLEELRRAAEARISDLADAVAASESVRIKILPPTDPASALVREAATADLLVVGAHRRGPVGALVGSTAGHCSRHAACPVVIVPPSWGARDEHH